MGQVFVKQPWEVNSQLDLWLNRLQGC